MRADRFTLVRSSSFIITTERREQNGPKYRRIGTRLCIPRRFRTFREKRTATDRSRFRASRLLRSFSVLPRPRADTITARGDGNTPSGVPAAEHTKRTAFTFQNRRVDDLAAGVHDRGIYHYQTGTGGKRNGTLASARRARRQCPART